MPWTRVARVDDKVRSPAETPALPRADLHWARQLILALALTGLVAAASSESWQFVLAALALSAASLGFFYLAFPGGLHFGLTMANFLAVYACLFAYFREANFPEARLAPTIVALVAPVGGFLLRCLLARRRVDSMIHVRRRRELIHLPRLTRWLPGTAVIGAATFLLPRFALSAEQQSVLLLVAMALIGAFVTLAQRDVLLLMLDVAMVFEGVAARINRLLMPAMAFLTVYALLVVVFACLYRVAQLTLGATLFLVHGQPGPVSFSDALYFSVITISTVGYGDITPLGPLVRALSAVEVVCGLMLLLFGFAEIMRGSGPESEHRRQLRPDRGQTPD